MRLAFICAVFNAKYMCVCVSVCLRVCVCVCLCLSLCVCVCVDQLEALVQSTAKNPGYLYLLPSAAHTSAPKTPPRLPPAFIRNDAMT